MREYLKICAVPMSIILCYFVTIGNAFSWFAGDNNKEEVPQEYRTITNRLNQVQSQYESVRQQLETAITQAKEKLNALNNSKTALEKEINATEEAIETLRKTNETRYNELAQQEQKLEEIENLLKAKSERIIDLMDAIKAEKLLAEKDRKISELNVNIQTATSSAESIQNELVNRNKSLKNEIEALKATNNEFRTSIDTLKKTVADQQIRIQSELQEKQKLSDEMANLKTSIRQFETEKNTALSNVETSLKEFESFIAEQKKQ